MQSVLCVFRSASGVIDQPDSTPVHISQRPEASEESTEYRGYTNPNVQSRSFKILQESLSYSEADEEGIVLPMGNTPGEGIVHKAYSEGKRRLEELSEINPRNFTTEGQSPYRVSEHYNIREESRVSAAAPSKSEVCDPTSTVAAAKLYDGSEPRRRRRTRPTPNIDIAQTSVLSPAAGQQQYLQQAKEHYQANPEPEPQPQPQPVIYQQKPNEKPLKLVNYQFDQQYSHQRREPVQASRQKAVVSPQKSNDFIPTTDTVSSVAADLDLKIISSDKPPQENIAVRQTAIPAVDVGKVIQAHLVQTIMVPKEPLVATLQKPVTVQANPVQTAMVSNESPVATIHKPAKMNVNKTVNSYAEGLSNQVVVSAKQDAAAAQPVKQESQPVPTQQVQNIEQPPQVKEEPLVKEKPVETPPEITEAAVEPQSQPDAKVAEKPDDQQKPDDSVTVQHVEQPPHVKEEPAVIENPVETSSEIRDVAAMVQEVVAPESPTEVSICESGEKANESTPVVSVEIKSEPNNAPEAITPADAEERQAESIQRQEPESSIESTEVIVQSPIDETSQSSEIPAADTIDSVSVAQAEDEMTVIVSNDAEENVESVMSSDEQTVNNVEQTINIVQDTTQPEELTFSVSVEDDEPVSENTAAFEITSDAEVSLNVSSDISFTTDVTTDITTDASIDEEAAVTIAFDAPVENVESENTDVTIAVAEEMSESKSNASAPEVSAPEARTNVGRKLPELQENGKTNAQPTRAKFLDSQGGVAARLAKLKQK